jgi:hypothetical protein
VVTVQEGSKKPAPGRWSPGGVWHAGPYSEMDGYLGGSSRGDHHRRRYGPLPDCDDNDGRYKNQQLVQPESIALMQTPPAKHRTITRWAGSRIRRRPAHHRAQRGAVRLLGRRCCCPKRALVLPCSTTLARCPSNAIGQPQIRAGLIALLTGEAPKTGWMNVGLWGAFTALLTLTGGFLAVRSLLALPRWAQKARAKPSGSFCRGSCGLSSRH